MLFSMYPAPTALLDKVTTYPKVNREVSWPGPASRGIAFIASYRVDRHASVSELRRMIHSITEGP
jgi:hypothetical protein